jgi:hypothetical protein
METKLLSGTKEWKDKIADLRERLLFVYNPVTLEKREFEGFDVFLSCGQGGNNGLPNESISLVAKTNGQEVWFFKFSHAGTLAGVFCKGGNNE